MGASEAKNWQQSAWQEKHVTHTGQAEPKRQVKVKVHKRWVTPGEKLMYTVFSVLAVVALFFAVSFSSSADALNRDVQQLQQQVQEQQSANENLQFKVKELSNPDRILRIAKENGLQIQNTQVKQASMIAN
ncbi:cell division protein FtsL [Aquibacillus kalidii]|uniref:cell division protein FtsL n=1 Tax=Aquibacillus kalidii TaxID=2762597 RepID=UPI0016463B9C|nr:cell division protein FtsL [Aquibacillus kalidii]